MHFQIFVPNKPDVGETLAAAGLDGLAENFDVRCSDGPEKQKGALFAWRSPAQQQWGFRPDQQEWIPAAAEGDLERGRYWVGIWKNGPPTPGDLARNNQQRGVSLMLGDGHSWIIPRAADLPHNIILLDNGDLEYVPQSRFHALNVEVDRWRTVVAESNAETEVPYQDLWQFALRALSINYRMTPEVASALNLFSTDNVQQPMFAAIGALKGK